MLLKRLERRKNGKGHTHLALVESIRTAKGSRHRVVACLGELKKSEKNGWAQLCRRLNGRARPQPSLFDPPHHDEPSDDEPVLVGLKNIRLQRLRDFGDIWLALGLWRLLGLDRLLPHQQAIEKHLKKRLGDLFDLDYKLLLYDVTSTYFEGECQSNPMAQRGHSRDSRPDCLQVCIGLVVTTGGIPLGYEVFDLTEAEWAFRIEKGELGIRPIWHQKESRVLGHILVCFLGYVLWKALAQWMRRAGLGDAPRMLIEEFAKIKSGDVVPPAQMASGSRRTIHLRCVTTPDEAQKVLLNRLGLTLPQRLRRIDQVARM